MTASYIARLYLRCFHGLAPHDAHGHPPHESPAIMVAPMVLLAFGALFAGLAGSPWLRQPLFHLLRDAHVHEGIDVPVLCWSTLAFAIGCWLAFTVGFRRRNLLSPELRPLGSRLYAWAFHKYYVDECYDRCIVWPFLRLAAGLAQWDQRVIDGAVNGAGRLGTWLSEIKAQCDRVIVDGLVNGVARGIRGVGATLRRIQTGVIQQYLLVVIIAVVVFSAIVRH